MENNIVAKQHFHILDGLRGVAAITVVWFHVFEAFATSHIDQKINHGYLAVDFFFILSGFVIGYAYDDRWGTMRPLAFIKRRLYRLHPMVIVGSILGAAIFYTQGCEVWDVSKVSVSMLLLSMVMGALLIPSTPGFEIRGVGEMFPLNGPTWSLFLEYIGNLLYLLFLRKFSTKLLSFMVLLAGAGLCAFAVAGPLGDICVGFALTGENILGGTFRLLFAFPAGLLLYRIYKRGKIRVKINGILWIGAAVIVAICAVPRIGGAEHLWLNGIYDSMAAIIVFPLLVYTGACGLSTGKTLKLCKFLGEISYPLYMVHYPFIYLYYAWVKNENLTFLSSLGGAVALFAGSLLLAYICTKLLKR